MPDKAKTTTQTQVRAKAQPARPAVQGLVQLEEDAQQAVQRAIADPAQARPGDILALQRAAGNRAVSRLIQNKLTVGPADDSYEQEADRVAEQVLSIPAPATQPANGGRAQRQFEEEEVQTKPVAAGITRLVQRVVQRGPLEEEEVQTKPLVQRQVEEDEIQTKPVMQRQAEIIQRGKTKGGGGGGGKGKQTTYKERMAAVEAQKAKREAAKKPERDAKKAAAEVKDTKLRAAAEAKASRQKALISKNDAAINASIRRVKNARKANPSANAGTNAGGPTIPGGTGNAIAIDRGLASDAFSIQDAISRPLDTSFSGLVTHHSRNRGGLSRISLDRTLART